MSNTRNTILDAFKAVADGMDSDAFGDTEAVIGLLRKSEISNKRRIEVWWHNDFGSHIEGKSRRRVRIVTAMKIKFDDSDATARGSTQLHQASEAYDAFHAAVETAINNAATPATPFYGFGYLKVYQEDEGIQCDGFGDGDEYLRIGEVWVAEYERAEGST